MLIQRVNEKQNKSRDNSMSPKHIHQQNKDSNNLLPPSGVLSKKLSGSQVPLESAAELHSKIEKKQPQNSFELSLSKQLSSLSQ